MNELARLTNEVSQYIDRNKVDGGFLSFFTSRFNTPSHGENVSIESELETNIIPELDQFLLQDDPGKKFAALKYIRKLTTLPDEQVPYKQIVESEIIKHLCVFLDSNISASFQFNSIWILQNILTKPKYYGDLPMMEIISQLVKLIKLTNQPPICTLCLRCVGTIIKGDYLFIDSILDSNIITILTGFDNKGDDVLYQQTLLFFIHSFCDCLPHIPSIRTLLDFLPLLSWLLECNHGTLSFEVQEEALMLLRSMCSIFQTRDQIEILLKQPICRLLIQQAIRYPISNLYIALDILLHLTSYGVPEELETTFKPLVPVLMYIIRLHMRETKTIDNQSINKTETTFIHWHSMSILEKMCRFNDVMIPTFLAANVYNTISSFITNTHFSQDEVSSQLALSIVVFSVFNADEQNLFYLCEENLMIILAWRLSLIAHYLHHHLENDLIEAVVSKNFFPSPLDHYITSVEDIVNKEEWVTTVTNDVIDSIVKNVIRDCEERDGIVEKAISTMVDIFIDSKEGNEEHTLEDDLVIKEVTDQMIDGIVDVICQPPAERQYLSAIEITQDIENTVNACELVILAISKLIMKGQRMVEAEFSHYNKYLRQLQTFTDIHYILNTLIVPTSVVLAWNRISMVLKGYDYYDYNWYDVAGCVVDETSWSLRKEDINHLIVCDTDFTATHLISSYSFNDTRTNTCWIITKQVQESISKDLNEEEERLTEQEEPIEIRLPAAIQLQCSTIERSMSQSGTEDERTRSTYNSILPLVLNEDVTSNTEDLKSPSHRLHNENSVSFRENQGFSKRFYASYDPNAVIVGSYSVGYPRRNTSYLNSDDVLSDTVLRTNSVCMVMSD